MAGRVAMAASIKRPDAAAQARSDADGCFPCRVIMELLADIKAARASEHDPLSNEQFCDQLGAPCAHEFTAPAAYVDETPPSQVCKLTRSRDRFGASSAEDSPFEDCDDRTHEVLDAETMMAPHSGGQSGETPTHSSCSASASAPPTSFENAPSFSGPEAVESWNDQTIDTTSTILEASMKPNETPCGKKTDEVPSADRNAPKSLALPSLLTSRFQNSQRTLVESATPVGSAQPMLDHRTPLSKLNPVKSLGPLQAHECDKATLHHVPRRMTKELCPTLDLVPNKEIMDAAGEISQHASEWVSSASVIIAASAKSISASAIDHASAYASAAGATARTSSKQLSDAAVDAALQASRSAAASTKTLSVAAADAAVSSTKNMTVLASDAAVSVSRRVDSLAHSYADQILQGMSEYHRCLQQQDISDGATDACPTSTFQEQPLGRISVPTSVSATYSRTAATHGQYFH